MHRVLVTPKKVSSYPLLVLDSQCDYKADTRIPRQLQQQLLANYTGNYEAITVLLRLV